MNETRRAKTWITGRLRTALTAANLADPTLAIIKVHDRKVPQELAQTDSAFPCYVIRSVTPARDTQGVAGYVIWANLEILIEVITKDSTYSSLERYNDILETALHRKSDGVNVISCVRNRPFEKEDIAEGHAYQRVGYYFSLQVKK